MKKIYIIKVRGCDDSSIFEMKLSIDEFKVVKRVAEQCTKTSTYSCMPTMAIEEKNLETMHQKRSLQKEVGIHQIQDA